MKCKTKLGLTFSDIKKNPVPTTH